MAKWGRMAIVDTKPFKLRVILHRIFVERRYPQKVCKQSGGVPSLSEQHGLEAQERR